MYRDKYEFLDNEDLLQTIGVSAVMGVNGVVLWGNGPSIHNVTMCKRAKDNLSKSLGPTIQTLSTFLKDCSTTLCNSNGRCILRGKVYLRCNQYTFLAHIFVAVVYAGVIMCIANSNFYQKKPL